MRRTHLLDLGSSRISLWVSRIDGSGMHEIGAAPSNLNPMMTSGPSDPETGETYWGPPFPRLMPGGKHVSFAYKRDLYTVPTE